MSTLTILTLRKSLVNVADGGFGKLKFSVPEGTKLRYIVIENETFMSENADQINYSLTDRDIDAMGNPATAGTMFYAGHKSLITTTGGLMSHARYEHDLRDKLLTQPNGLYFQFLNNMNEETTMAVEIEVEVPD